MGNEECDAIERVLRSYIGGCEADDVRALYRRLREEPDFRPRAWAQAVRALPGSPSASLSVSLSLPFVCTCVGLGRVIRLRNDESTNSWVGTVGRWFVKLVPSGMQASVDPIATDAINGSLVVRLLPGRLQRHLIRFYDAFPTSVDTADRAWPCPISCGKGQQLARAVVFRRLRGTDLWSLSEPDLVRWALFFSLPRLYEDGLAELWTRHGFVHNDLHAGNLFYDAPSRRLVVIDLGRTGFGAYKGDPRADRIAARELARLGQREQPYAAFGPGGKQCRGAFVVDVIALAMSAYRQYRAHVERRHPGFPPFLAVAPASEEGAPSAFRVRRAGGISGILSDYLEHPLYEHRGLEIMAEGAMLFAAALLVLGSPSRSEFTIDSMVRDDLFLSYVMLRDPKPVVEAIEAHAAASPRRDELARRSLFISSLLSVPWKPPPPPPHRLLPLIRMTSAARPPAAFPSMAVTLAARNTARRMLP